MTIYGINLPSSWLSHPYFKKLLEKAPKDNKKDGVGKVLHIGEE